jgi:hypothetical protein
MIAPCIARPIGLLEQHMIARQLSEVIADGQAGLTTADDHGIDNSGHLFSPAWKSGYRAARSLIASRCAGGVVDDRLG